MRGAAVGVIKASKSKTFPVGSYATASAGWTEFAVLNEKDLSPMDIPANGKVTDSLGVLGVSGLQMEHCYLSQLLSSSQE